MPPPAEGLASRLFLGPALRAQPDRRLVTLVREGYEAAFEEIVRRYGRSLGRYAASIVGGRSEDVLQEAFAKALPALQRDDAEIDLRPWLFRIVRNTALNDLRDSPPSPELLAEALAGGRNPADELEQRERLADLMRRLRELPEPQRAAIVMRELEGLGHEEIAAALGLTGGGARQAIYRARQALRDGAGLLLPLPFVRMLIDHGAETAAGAGAGGALAAAGASASGAGAGGALKIGVVTAVLAGSVGAGVAVQDHRDGGGETARANPAPPAARAAPGPSSASAALASSGPVDRSGSGHSSEDHSDSHHGDEDSSGRGGPGSGELRHRGGSIPPRHGGPGPSRHGGRRHGGHRDDGHREGRHGEREGRPDSEDLEHRGDEPRHGGRPGPGGGSGEDGDGRRGGRDGGDSTNSGSGPEPEGDTDHDRSGPGDGSESQPPPPAEEELESQAVEEPRDLEP
jgi:RNA polymerase sigma factor (sigma-70 family)